MWNALHSLKHQSSYFPLCILNWPNKQFGESDESGWSSFRASPSSFLYVKPSKAQRRYLRWTPNQQAIKGWRLWLHLVWNRDCWLEWFRDVAHNFLVNAKAPNYIKLVDHIFFFRLSEFFFYPLLTCLDIGAGVEQPFGCLIVQNRQAV